MDVSQTTSALSMKHVDIEAVCPWCRSVMENDVHVLFECDFARTMWQTSGMHDLVEVMPDDTALSVFSRCFSRDQCVLIGMLGWNLWN